MLFIISIIQVFFKKDRTFAIKILLLILQHFKCCAFQLVPYTGDKPFPTFRKFLELFQERTFSDGAQFSYHIFLNLFYGLEATSFQIVFKFWKQKNICWG